MTSSSLSLASGRRVTKAFGTTPQYGLGDADHRRFQDIRVLVQDALHLDRGDVDPSADDHLLLPVFQLDIPRDAHHENARSIACSSSLAVSLLYRRVTLILAWLANSNQVG
jgi:hypothetical protein